MSRYEARRDEALPETMTYRAFNGHVMVADVTGREPDGRLKYIQWSARHADECQCDGEPLPDW